MSSLVAHLHAKRLFAYQAVKLSLIAAFPLRSPSTVSLFLQTVSDINRALEDTAVENCNIPLLQLL